MQCNRKKKNGMAVTNMGPPWEAVGVIEYLKEKRAMYWADTRRANYELIEAAANVVQCLQQKPSLLKKLVNHRFFKPMKGQHPKSAHNAVMHFVLKATTDNQRKRANRFGQALDILLSSGVPIKNIAERLACSGGVNAVLVEAKVNATGSSIVMKPSALPARVRQSAIPESRKRSDVDDHGKVEDDDLEDADNGDDERDQAGPGCSGGGSGMSNRVNYCLPGPAAGKAYVHIEVPVVDLPKYIEQGPHLVSYQALKGNGFVPLIAKALDESRSEKDAKLRSQREGNRTAKRGR